MVGSKAGFLSYLSGYERRSHSRPAVEQRQLVCGKLCELRFGTLYVPPEFKHYIEQQLIY